MVNFVWNFFSLFFFANFQVSLGQSSRSRFSFNKFHIGSHLIKKILLKHLVFVILLTVQSLCPLFFIEFLFFYHVIVLQKLWKMFSFLSKKLFSFLRYSNLLWFFLFLSTLSGFKRTNGSGIIYDVMSWLAKIWRCNIWNNSKTAYYYTIKLGQIVCNW